MLDILFIEPNSVAELYQDLGEKYAAIETPTWALLLAQSCRSRGYRVGILDANAERLDAETIAKRVALRGPRIVCFTVYGQNPNSGTANMAGVYAVASYLKGVFADSPKEWQPKICVVGSHASALPFEVLERGAGIDIVLTNEGVYALWNLLASDLSDESLKGIKGIACKLDDGKVLYLNDAERIVSHDRMEDDLPGYAWDLLPYKKEPFDLYRAHYWHSNYSDEDRTPFAAIYTSLGCPFQCEFCMINIVNRTDNSLDKVSSDFNVIRYWSPEFIIKEFDKLAEYGVKNIRISDEMFFLNRKHYGPLLDLLIERNHGFNMWAYSRIDTCRPEYLGQFKKAGINWLALGIEAANRGVRLEITKGKFIDTDIKGIVEEIKKAGINVVGNFIFGFPDEDYPELLESLKLAIELKCEFTNMYTATALPGSPLYRRAVKEGWDLPKTAAEWGFYSYDYKPLPTKHLTGKQVLAFRDWAWQIVNNDKKFLTMIEEKFGPKNRLNVQKQTLLKLRRKELGD